MSPIGPARSPFIVSTPAMTDTPVRIYNPLDLSPNHLPRSCSSSPMEGAPTAALTFSRLRNTSGGGGRTQASDGVNGASNAGSASSTAGARHSQSGSIARPSEPTDRVSPSNFHTSPYADAQGGGHSLHLGWSTRPWPGQLSPAHQLTYTCSGSAIQPSHDVPLMSQIAARGHSTLAGGRAASQCLLPVLSSPQAHAPQHTNTTTQVNPSLAHSSQIPDPVPTTTSSPIPIPVQRSPSQIRHIQTYNASLQASLQASSVRDHFHPHIYTCTHTYHGIRADALPHSFPSASREYSIPAGGCSCACYGNMYRDTSCQYRIEDGRCMPIMSGAHVDGLPFARSPVLCGPRSLPCACVVHSPPWGVAHSFPDADAVQVSSERLVRSASVNLRRSALIREGLGNLDVFSRDRHAEMIGIHGDMEEVVGQGDIPDSVASTSRVLPFRPAYMRTCACGAREVAAEGDCGWACSHFEQVFHSPLHVSSLARGGSECWHHHHHSHHYCHVSTSGAPQVSHSVHSTVGQRLEVEDRTSLPSRSVPVEGETSALSPLSLPALAVPQFLSASQPSQPSQPQPQTQTSGALRGPAQSEKSVISPITRNAETQPCRTSPSPPPSTSRSPTPNACLQTVDATISDLESVSRVSRTRPRAYSHPHPPSHARVSQSSVSSPQRDAPSSSLHLHHHRSRTLSHQSQKPKLTLSLSTSVATSSSSSSTTTTYGTLTSLASLGIGLAEAEREERKSKGFFRKRAGSLGKGQVQAQQGAESSKDKEKRNSVFGIRKDVADAYIGQECVRRAEQGGSRNGDDGGGEGRGDVGGHHKSHILRSGGREYERVREHVSHALTSIISPVALEKMSPAGRAIARAGHTASSVAHSLLPAVKEGLVISSDLLQFAPLPGLEEAAKTLLAVWEACEDVDTNRLSCLRLTERCATLLISVRCEIAEAGDGVADELSVPVGKLCNAFHLVLEFLQRQLHRSFLTRYLWRAEIQREIAACDKAISDVMSMFGFSIQMRLLKYVLATADESKRFAEEVQHQLESGVMALPLAGNALGLSTGTPPPTYPGALPSVGRLSSVSGDSDAESEERTPMQSMFPATCLPIVETVPVIPVVDTEEEDRVGFPLHTLTQLHATQNASDSAADDAALRAILHDVIRSGSTEVLREAGGALMDRVDMAFLEGGVEGLGRFCDVRRGAMREVQGTKVESALDLPCSAITRYAIDMERQIGAGSCSKVYLGQWRQQTVAIKVLAATITSRSFDLCELEGWRSLQHPNVLPLYEASTTSGPHPCLFVSKFCVGGSLVTWLKAAKACVDLDGAGSMRNAGVDDLGEEPDLLRYIHEVSQGMAYLHEKAVLHGDLRAANVLVDEEGHCVVSDYGQSEIKSEVYRLSGQPLLRGRLQWHAPELLRGDDRRTTATDVYAFAICCVEILGMGDLPWTMLEDATVVSLVLDEDQRPSLPPSRHASTIAPLIAACWEREPDSRPSFMDIVGSIGRLRGRAAHDPGLSLDASSSVGPVSLPYVGVGTGCVERGVREDSSTEVSPADECYETAAEVTPVESETRSQVRIPSPVYLLNRHASRTSAESTNDRDADIVLVPDQELSGAVVHPFGTQDARKGHSGGSFELMTSDTLESVVRSRDMVDTPSNEWIADARDERRYRLGARHTHGFHPSLTLPLWSPTYVALGAVGYLSKPKGEFIVLFNALDPFKTASGAAKDIKSIYAYGKLKIETRSENKQSVVQRGLDMLSGFLTFNLRNNEPYSEKVGRRYSFPLIAGQTTARVCAESTIYRRFVGLEAFKDWFKRNVDVVLKEYAPQHPIHKEDLCLVVGTLGAPDYTLFVSHSHPEGQAHFNVFMHRKAGQPWGRFTTDTKQPVTLPADGSCDEKVLEKPTFASKVSIVRGIRRKRDSSPVLAPAKWDTLLVARLGFEPGVEDPVLL